MPLHRSSLLVALTTLSFRLPVSVECIGDNWYPKICSTGEQKRVTFDENGRVSFVAGDSIVDREGNSTGNRSDHENNDSYTAEQNGEGGRWLRRSGHSRNIAYGAVSTGSASSAAAQPWMRQTYQQENLAFYGMENPFNLTILTSLQPNFSQSQPPEFLRPCLCHPNDFFQNYFGPNETVPDLYLCQGSATYCGIPLPGTGPVGCFDVTFEEQIAVNAWGVVLLGYIGLVLLCCLTSRGKTTIDFCRSLYNPELNRRNVDRLMARNASSQPPSHWNAWATQNYQFEQRILANVRMVLRSQDIAHDQQRQEQGLPPPAYEMKTKRYSKEHNCTAEADDDGDDNSVQEIACTICFLPLEDGDIVGDLACHHIFHKSCLKSWLARKNACPLCNTILATRRPDPRP